MSNTITLPPIKVSAVASAFSPSRLGAEANMPNPAATLAAQHPKRLQMYAEGYWREVFIKHMEELNRQLSNGWRYVPTMELMFDLQKIPIADKYMCLNPHALSSEAVREAVNGWGYRRKIFDARELSGGILSSAAAFGHYFLGDGSDVITNIQNLGLNLSASKIPLLEQAFSSAVVGSSPINLDKVAYDTGNDSWITASWLGNITLKIEGVVHKFENGQLSFSGTARAYNDVYDFNASVHRSDVGEAATAGGRYLESIMKPNAFQVVIQGELPISIER